MIGSAADIVSGVFQDLDPRKCAVVVGLAVVVGALASIPLSRACNRRALLIVSAIGVTMCHAIMGLYRYYEEDLSENYGWLLLLTLVSYICLFMVSFLLKYAFFVTNVSFCLEHTVALQLNICMI